ncbi:hypothetical protein ROHU_025607 [Labeo rohita]|uniref:Uncharacterized protein n=1 Tax=Labeo rohita TaxID=84645 RepID=A0A498MK84_LABRO|nr:hypothetical protein ROHU_025607 [Labeo rohita]
MAERVSKDVTAADGEKILLKHRSFDKIGKRIPEKNMNPNQLAVLQLQKLKYASERLSNVDIQEMVMDELKSLHLYMRGKGFRKNTND